VKEVVKKMLRICKDSVKKYKHFFFGERKLSSKLGGTAEGLPARNLAAFESFPLRYQTGAEVRTDGEEP
jgi:hypothetical protein